MPLQENTSGNMSLQSKLESAQARLQKGELEQAIKIYIEILGSNEHQPDAVYMLGAIAYKLGQMPEALEFATTLSVHAPQDARGWTLKALCLRAQRQANESMEAAHAALEIDDGIAEAWECIGMALMQFGDWQQAHEHFERAVARLPDNATLRGCYAMVLAEQGDLPAAWRESQQALSHDAQCKPARLAEITTLMHAGYCDLALARCRETQKAGEAVAFTQATAALLTGNFEEGYAFMAAAMPLHAPEQSIPDWQGKKDPAAHLVLYNDQGYGDTLQMIRFARRAAEKVGRITLRVPQQLERLISHSMPELPLSVYRPLTTDTRRPMHENDPAFDFPSDATKRSSLNRLPHLLKIGAHTDAEAVPYLRTDPAWAEPWRERLALVQRPRIGLVWSGSTQNPTDHRRSIPFAELAPLTVKFRQHIVSMQTGAVGEQARGADLLDATPFIRDFADSAGLLEELDLLITVDTAPAHLAGAMGKPAWLALAFDNDWRWLIAREDSIWYPTLRLFRQPQPGDWKSVVEKFCVDLEKFVGGDGSVIEPVRWTQKFLARNPAVVPLPELDG